jgi:hypothetical protein
VSIGASHRRIARQRPTEAYHDAAVSMSGEHAAHPHCDLRDTTGRLAYRLRLPCCDVPHLPSTRRSRVPAVERTQPARAEVGLTFSVRILPPDTSSLPKTAMAATPSECAAVMMWTQMQRMASHTRREPSSEPVTTRPWHSTTQFTGAVCPCSTTSSGGEGSCHIERGGGGHADTTPSVLNMVPLRRGRDRSGLQKSLMAMAWWAPRAVGVTVL